MQLVRKGSRRGMAFLLISALLLGCLPLQSVLAQENASSSDYGLSSPTIDNEGVTTWDCVYFGNYW